MCCGGVLLMWFPHPHLATTPYHSASFYGSHVSALRKARLARLSFRICPSSRVRMRPALRPTCNSPEGRQNNDLGALRDEFSERVRKGQIPADQQAYFAERRVERNMRVMLRATGKRSLRMPGILLRISTRDLAAFINKIGDIHEDPFLCVLVLVLFKERARDKTNATFSRELTVLVQILFPTCKKRVGAPRATHAQMESVRTARSDSSVAACRMKATAWA